MISATSGPSTSFYTGTFDSSQVVTLNPDILDKSNPYYLGTGVNLAVAIVTFILCVIAVTLNAGVIRHFREQIKDVVPFMCYLLGVTDLAVGICAGLHSILFIVLLATEGSLTVGTMGIIAPAHYFSFLALKVSVFFSMVFAVVQSINMNTFIPIKKSTVVVAIGIWLFCLSIISLVEIGIYVSIVDGIPSSEIPGAFLMGFFYQPNKPKVLDLIQHISGIFMFWEVFSECTKDIIYTALLLTVCVLPTFLAVLHQLFLLLCRHKYREEGTMRRVTVTLLLLEVLSLVAALFPIAQPISTCSFLRATDLRNLYLLGYIPFFLRSALNPVVMLFGICPLRCMKQSGQSCSSIQYVPVKV